VEQHHITHPPQPSTARRAILAGIAATAASVSLAARAQQTAQMRRLGVLMGLANDPEGQARAAALTEGLGALNLKDGGNLRIEWRWAGGDPARVERYATELVALGPEVLLASGSAELAALRRKTRTIPIVFAQVTDPVGQGFVEGVAHPGGNITGFSTYDPPMAGKWLGMLTQVTPPIARVAVLYTPANPSYVGLMRGIENAVPSVAVTVRGAPVQDDAETEAAMAGLAREERGGLVVLPESFTTTHRDAIVALAARYRLAAVYPHRFFAAIGGLMSYDTDFIDLYRRSASYVDRILNGAKPADLPVQAPTKFELVINLKTAKALGVTVAPSLIDTADEVIE